jgi:hypothetical protein
VYEFPKGEATVIEVGMPVAGLLERIYFISYLPAFPIKDKFPKTELFAVLLPMTSSCICMMIIFSPTAKLWYV